MDNLTHTLTGLMLSRAGLNRWCPAATPILLLAANAPDIDTAMGFGNSLDFLEVHRGITHSFVFSPLLAAVVTAGVYPFARRNFRWIPAFVAALAGILSHLLLDWTNTYGIRLLLPFSSEWLRLDATNIVDLCIWSILLLSIAGPLLSRLVSSEIGAKPTAGRGAAIFALLFLIAYNYGRYTLHERALNVLNSHLYSGSPPLRVAAFPHFVNPFQWMTLVETQNAVLLQKVNLLLPYDPAGGEIFYAPQPSPALEAARRTATLRRFLTFAQFPFYQATTLPEGATRIDCMDLRFGDPSAPRFVASVTLDAAQQVREEQFSFGALGPR